MPICSESGLIFISADRYRGVGVVFNEFKKGFSEIPTEKRILCAHSGRSFQIGQEVSSVIKAKITKSLFLESDHQDSEATMLFVENYIASCKNGEAVIVVVDRKKFNYIRKHLRVLAGYFVGDFYTLK